MISAFFPFKKLRRNTKHLLFGAILLVGVVAVYHEMVAAKAWSGETSKFVVASHCYDRSYSTTFLKVIHHLDCAQV